VWADYITELAGDPIVSAAHHVEAVAAVVLGESSHSASSSIEVKAFRCDLAKNPRLGKCEEVTFAIPSRAVVTLFN
jgi:hypothetical protein